MYEVIQDSKGYMWFATDRGVARFNGYEFHTFTTNDGLTDNTVFRLFEDYNGRIWMYSFSIAEERKKQEFLSKQRERYHKAA